MSGHSKWATTRHEKVTNDARRTREWAKMTRNIKVAARIDGGDPVGNPTLDNVIKKAKEASVSDDNTERVRKRGSDEEPGGADWETIVYKGYAPGGVVLIAERLIDNRNHVTSDMRPVLSRNSGNMVDNGAVTYLSEEKGTVKLPKGELTEDDLLMVVLDAGAEEANDLGEKFEVVSASTGLMDIRTALVDTEMEYSSADRDYRASTTVALGADGARKLSRLIDALKKSNDVQGVCSDADISDEVIAKLDS